MPYFFSWRLFLRNKQFLGHNPTFFCRIPCILCISHLCTFSFLPRQADTRISTEFGTTNNSTDAEPDNEDELDELLDNNSSTVPVQNNPFPSPAEYRKLSLEKRAKLLPPPSDDRMEELKKYQDRMGYTEESMRSMRYKMSVYDDFTEEYDYRVKYNRNHPSEEQLKAQGEQQIITPVRRRGRGR